MPNFGRIVPVLTYQDVAAAHDFLVQAFGFNGGGVQLNTEGRPSTARSARVTPRFGYTVRWRSTNSVPQASDVANLGLFVYVDNVDAHHDQARTAGARIDSQPVDQPYGQREYGARDLEGHRWWFATPVVKRQG